MTAPEDLSALKSKPFSDAVKRLEELLVQGGRTFLIGAGCSKCAGLPLMEELTDVVINSDKLDPTSKKILADIKELFNGATTSHIEDYLSELVDLLAIADRRAGRGATEAQVPINKESYSAAQLRTATEQIKKAISSSIDKKVNIEAHRKFVAAVHRPVRVGKAAASSVVDYLLLNYDTVIEDALALERISFSDGIDGGVTGWWSPVTFDRDGLAARVLKLHGSVNWCEVAGDPLPRRIASSLHVQDMQDRNILIWPASTKYRETQLDPFAQLAERARRTLRPVRGTQRVLVICGYSFGDAHVNIEVEKALKESAGDLTVIAFSSEERPMGKLKEWNESVGIREQVLIYARRGFFHGDVAEVSEHDLPWWKFENLARLLGGER
jgi:hypothetical protein